MLCSDAGIVTDTVGLSETEWPRLMACTGDCSPVCPVDHLQSGSVPSDSNPILLPCYYVCCYPPVKLYLYLANMCCYNLHSVAVTFQDHISGASYILGMNMCYCARLTFQSSLLYC